jgi:outer membrane immunogenic protein
MSNRSRRAGGARAAAILFATLFAQSAAAADLGRGPAVSAQPFEQHAAYGAYRWSGFHIGLTYGYASGWTDVDFAGSAFDIDTTGGNGSIFAGYDWQIGNVIAGFEADIGTGTLGGSENAMSTELSSLGSIRGRLGYLVSPAFLVYATAGFAYADFDVSANSDSQSETFTGYQIGGGSELRFSEPWSLRLEYVYTDLDPETLDHNGLANTYEPDFHTVRAGISYKF